MANPSVAAAAGTIRVGDFTVNRMGFGAMRLCGTFVWGWPSDRANAGQVLRRALELGVNLIDTADSYGPETSESMIAEFLYPYPKGLVIATKGGFTRPNRFTWGKDGRPEHLKSALEGSLRRLRLEQIDVYQFHTPDPAVPYAESIGALAELQRAGKIRHLGVSNVNVAQLEEARRITPIVSVQNEYNIRQRSSDDVLHACERLNIPFLPWYPLGGLVRVRGAAINRVAKRHGATSAQVALAWLLAKSAVMLPIPGTQSLEHLEENLAAAALKLTSEDVEELGR